MRQPRHLFFHQACAAYSRITLGLCFSKRGVQGVDVSLHGAPQLLRLLLLLRTLRNRSMSAMALRPMTSRCLRCGLRGDHSPALALLKSSFRPFLLCCGFLLHALQLRLRCRVRCTQLALHLPHVCNEPLAHALKHLLKSQSVHENESAREGCGHAPTSATERRRCSSCLAPALTARKFQR